MKAKINKNVGEYQGIHIVHEIFKNRVTLLIDGNKVDFGVSEVKIVTENSSDRFDTGAKILTEFGNDGDILQQVGINKIAARVTCTWPISKCLAAGCISDWVYNC